MNHYMETAPDQEMFDSMQRIAFGCLLLICGIGAAIGACIGIIATVCGILVEK